MPLVSDDLTWQLIRSGHGNSFLVKKADRVWSTEKGNLLSLHSPKYSGLANTKTIDVAAGKRGIVLTTQKKKTSKQMPAKRIAKQDLTWGISRTVKSVKGSAEYYRSDLVDAAIAKAAAIINGQSKKTRVTKLRK